MASIKPEVTKFLAEQPQKMLIGGKWVAAKSDATFETLGGVLGPKALSNYLRNQSAVRVLK